MKILIKCGKAEALQGNPCGVSSDLNVPLVCWTFSVDCSVKLLLHVIEIIKDTFILCNCIFYIMVFAVYWLKFIEDQLSKGR